MVPELVQHEEALAAPGPQRGLLTQEEGASSWRFHSRSPRGLLSWSRALGNFNCHHIPGMEESLKVEAPGRVQKFPEWLLVKLEAQKFQSTRKRSGVDNW